MLADEDVRDVDDRVSVRLDDVEGEHDEHPTGTLERPSPRSSAIRRAVTSSQPRIGSSQSIAARRSQSRTNASWATSSASDRSFVMASANR
jgi:hypothetical protein